LSFDIGYTNPSSKQSLWLIGSLLYCSYLSPALGFVLTLHFVELQSGTY
jgi:hypothetical protein